MKEAGVTWGSLEAAAQDRAKWKQFVGGLQYMLHIWSDKGLSQVSHHSNQD